MRQSPKKSVYVAVLNQGEIRTELVQTLIYLDRSSDYRVKLDFPSEKPIANNRNQIVERFLDSGYDYLVQIDDDIVPPPNFLELIDYDVDVVTPLMYAYRSIGLVPLILERINKKSEKDKDDEYLERALNLGTIIGDEDEVTYTIKGQQKDINYRNKGLVECDATGTGCMIVKREVLEDMDAPFLDVFSDDVGDRILGLDLNFCHRAKQKGYNVYVHTDYEASHFTVMDQKDVYKQLNQKDISVQSVGNRTPAKQKGR